MVSLIGLLIIVMSAGVSGAKWGSGGVLRHLHSEEHSHQFRSDPGPEGGTPVRHDSQHGMWENVPVFSEIVLKAVFEHCSLGKRGLHLYHLRSAWSSDCSASSFRRGLWLSVSSTTTVCPVCWPTTPTVAGASWTEGQS